MAKYYVKVVDKSDGCHVLANLPSGVFSRGPMPEKKAVAVAMDMQEQMKKVGDSQPLWKRIWFRLTGWKPVMPPPPPPPEEEWVLRCPRHPQWKAVYVKGKWVCSFCQKELDGRRGDD